MTNLRVRFRRASSPAGWGLALLLLVCPIQVKPALAAVEEQSGKPAVSAETIMPAGRVIFSRRGDPKKQIYILGQNHRSATTGLNGDKTVQAQLEIYRIGEWLIRQRQVELLLPEGFFGDDLRRETPPLSRYAAAVGVGQPWVASDNQLLWEKLADANTLTNAAMLLNVDYGVRFGQVEDQGLYDTVADSYRQLNAEEGLLSDLIDRLVCFQERRSAAMLQQIPTVVEREFRSGNIQSQQAMFIVGMAHIAEIIRFLESETIALTPARLDLVRSTPMAVALLRENYGITVILPHSLAADEEVLRLTRLSDFVAN